MDVDLFRFINGRLINPIFDQVMPFLSGNAFFIPAVIALGLLVICKFRARGAVFFILLALSVALYTQPDPSSAAELTLRPQEQGA